MNQYCRYCSNCFENDALYCAVKDAVLPESTVKHTNQCKDFNFVNVDVFTGNQYRPHKRREKSAQYEQLSLCLGGMK